MEKNSRSSTGNGHSWLPALSFHSTIANDGSRLFVFFVSQHVPKADMPHMITLQNINKFMSDKHGKMYVTFTCERPSQLCFFVLLSLQLPFLFQRICQLL